MRIRLIVVSAACALLWSCGGGKPEERTTPEKVVSVPPFNSDSAYFFVQHQVDFGPRIPNTKPHEQTGDFLVSTLKRYGASVVEQHFEAPSLDGQRLQLRNIIASFGSDKPKRIILAAHWDTRPFADKDPTDSHATFEGANDGASGVGVLLEVARQLGKQPVPQIGVDIILFDGEDWGERDDATGQVPPPKGYDVWWCLGSQYWARQKHTSNYAAYYGILLDMVGAKNAKFFREATSLEFAPRIVSKVWSTAARLGYSDYFVTQNAGAITDDHVFMNEVGKIPTIDIVHYQPGIGYFGDFHHNRKDNMSLISKETLAAVGNTLLNVVYYED